MSDKDNKEKTNKEVAKASFKRIFEKFSVKKYKKEMEDLDKRTSFVEEEFYPSSDEIIEEGRFSNNKQLKKKADKVRGINFISLPLFLKRDCEKAYSYFNLLIHFLIAFLVIAALGGLVFKLKLVPIIVLCVLYLCFGPSLIYFHYRKKREQTMFSECVRYIEQMLYSFTRKSKIVTALEECRLIINGNLGKAIDFAIEKIYNGTAQENIYTVALKEVDAILPCTRVKNLHEFLAEVENVGGKHSTALDIMLEDLREWDIRTSKFQENQAVKGMGMLLSIFMSLGTCLFMTNILPADMGGDISGFGLYQWITTISIIVMFFIYRFVARKLTRSWIVDDAEVDQEEIDRDCEKIEKYFKTKKGIKPILAMTRIKTELEKKFPRWVLRFSLLASSQSIPAALRNSVDSCPNVIRRELEKLIDEIDKHPTSIEPYLNFFGYLDVPQVRSMMLMIYSLSEYGSDDIDKHVLSIVKRNYSLQATSEQIANEESLARFSIYVTAPMIIACVVMMIDVAMIVFNMISMVSAEIAF